MLTGDAKPVADQVAQSLGIDQVYSQLLPAGKVEKVEELLLDNSERGKLAFVGTASTTPRSSAGRISASPWAPWAPMPPSRPPTWS